MPSSLAVGALALRRLVGILSTWMLTTVNKRRFCAALYKTSIILPRQARDKHGENSKNMAFP
jgi:hypothetical protein